MTLPYYSVAAREEFWTEHWGGHSVEELLAVARVSPLTPLVTAALPAKGRVLEAGCGLGQYVLLLRERGWQAMGVDWSVDALAGCRRVAKAPLAAMELRALAVRDDALAAYISLGVVEHDPDGPDAILAEARRVLAPGGVIVVSVPYLNGIRRLAAPYLRRRGRRIAAAGGSFYQYAFSRAELVDVLRRHGFTPHGAHPYDPVRIIRGALKALRRPNIGMGGRDGPPKPPGARPAAAKPRPASMLGGPVPAALPPGARPARARPWPASILGGPVPAAPPGGARPAAAKPGPASVLRGAVRGAFYTGPALRLLGHMLLVVAVKR